MKVYNFYLIKNSEPQLYAFTDNKDYADEWKERRDMNKFIYKKIEMSHAAFREYKNKYKGCYMTRTSFVTKSNHCTSTKVDVLCSWKEEEDVLFKNERLWEEYVKYLFDAKIFKKEYIVALEKLLFFKFLNFYKRSKTEDPFYSVYIHDMNEFIWQSSDFKYDDLQLFIRFNGYTFK